MNDQIQKMGPPSNLSARMLDRLGGARVIALLARADLRVIVTVHKAVLARKMLDAGTLWPGGPTIPPLCRADMEHAIRCHARAQRVAQRVVHMLGTTEIL